MKHFLLAIGAVLVWGTPGFTQFTTVTYDTYKNWFNEGQALPAEEAMIFKGIMPDNIERVEIQILSSNGKVVLHQAAGRAQSSNEFSLPVNYRLRASDKYDFQIDFFRPVSSQKLNMLKENLKATLDTYVEVNLTGDKSIKLLSKSGKTVKEMNEIAGEAMSRYRGKMVDWQPSFSEVIRLKLEQLDKSDLDQAYVKGDTTTNRKKVRNSARQKLIGELKEQIHREVDQMLDMDLLVVSESQIVDDYPTEPKEKGLSVNVGYGGVYLNGKLDDLNYGSSPYLGLAFPLGNKVLGSRFFGNSSLTIGFFLQNFEDEKGNKISGIIVDRPLYLGLDYKLFEFVRFNAGAAFLEKTEIKNIDGTDDLQIDKDMLIRPFIGLSAKIDLSIGLGK